ncbi:DNA-binding transcriptional ArsR family regulator [Sinorhizobium terangae]|uniref:STAS domain-containing protein n=1 Tax=Sinorhizobium terangae TaxID=110322 RepID=A0A6N7LAL3_SINTE|nr:STAS domain-containing protein [Sinorhizobium terangae]MBB4187801.1 DNA-binding transcriptional ArsR family regulator [Sinorhizobium terangae]MQX13945.1 hypothetical protein [Sinorhizobium terangae]
MTDPDAEITQKLELPPALTIRHGGALRDELLSAFEKAGRLAITVPANAEVDLSFVQLVEATRRYAATLGRAFGLSRPAEGALLSTLERGGFLTKMNPEDREFWFHRKEQQ